MGPPSRRSRDQWIVLEVVIVPVPFMLGLVQIELWKNGKQCVAFVSMSVALSGQAGSS
ncbi:hypothetical protein Poly41_09530 [Novipirellula artificiosorum]|uniref:Uncharacterized protein n=1 Tax=Novipirellula artificiosorum TaxID=2528016 RepID=A0A5C6E2D4_9BACT|nr:hypothetical protein Poly41_09530 [Novipirellula artificiosorum]